MVGQGEQRQHQRIRAERGQQAGGGDALLAGAESQHAAMHRKAGDRVQHVAAGAKHRNLVPQAGQHARQLVQPPAVHQGRHRAKPPRADQSAEHHLAFRHEQAPAADQIALAHVAIGLDARVAGIVDRLETGHGPRGLTRRGRRPGRLERRSAASSAP